MKKDISIMSKFVRFQAFAYLTQALQTDKDVLNNVKVILLLYFISKPG